MTFDDISKLASKRDKFLFISDFTTENIIVIPIDKLDKYDIEFCIDGSCSTKPHKRKLQKKPVDFSEYSKKFNFVIEKIKSGETYLLNLTQPTLIDTEFDIKQIYEMADAPYKLRYKDEFVCFSPERFISIYNNKIHTYPMKGTIDASIENAKDKILSDQKELAEHIMIVDLLRNDLSIVSKKIKVEKFRYIDEIEAGDKKLLQVSSHISGELESNWRENLGYILKSLLPAGSISGTPKKSTLDIIKQVEGYDRGFFSGVFGVFDGDSFESFVMIRFIERNNDKILYKSGGGITLDSYAKSEYNEMIDKIYIP